MLKGACQRSDTLLPAACFAVKLALPTHAYLDLLPRPPQGKAYRSAAEVHDVGELLRRLGLPDSFRSEIELSNNILLPIKEHVFKAMLDASADGNLGQLGQRLHLRQGCEYADLRRHIAYLAEQRYPGMRCMRIDSVVNCCLMPEELCSLYPGGRAGLESGGQ